MSASAEAAGLRVRVAAGVLDAALAVVLTRIAVLFGHWSATYVPFELGFVLAWLAYAWGAAIWRRRTTGKWVLGLSVDGPRGRRADVARLLWREMVKLVAIAPLGLGLWWIGLTRAKRGWHDYLSGSRVTQEPRLARRRKCVTRLVGCAVVGAAVAVVAPRLWDYGQAAGLTPAQFVAPGYVTPPVDVGHLADADRGVCLEWLRASGSPAEEYAIGIAERHQLTIFGETHHVADNLQFLARLIPDLYRRAGVTCIAMEALVSGDNHALNELVTRPEFDRRRAVSLGRHECWKSWGSSEYWDVLEAVWRLNSSLGPGEPPMRVIGLDREWDMPSWSLVGAGDDARPGPWWERMRVVRVVLDLPLLAKRDELMAVELEREVFAAGQRGVAWVGAAHAYTDYALPLISGRAEGPRRYRLGGILRQRYGGRVCHLRMHDSSYEGAGLAIFIESVEMACGGEATGFEVTGSPFADLRDGGGPEYRRDPTARFADFADGYIFLKPLAELQHCRWEPGFITQGMFLRDKPYYEAQTGRQLRNAEEANATFRRKWEP